MDDFEELEDPGSVDFTQPDNIQAEPGQRTGEDAKGDATDLAQTVANSSSESRVEPFSKSGLEASSEEAARTGQPKGETANDFTSWERLLLSSEKGGLGWKNSKYFKRVQNALEKTAVVLSKNFSNVAEDNKAMLLEACNVFQALLDACKQYTARNPRTKNGKVRRDIVLQIQNYAEKDLRGCGSKLFEFYSMPADEQAKENWQSVLGGVRAMQLTVADYSKLVFAEGGKVSEVIKIESPDGDPTGTKYFKKEDSINMDVIKEKGEGAPPYLAMQETLKKYPNLSEKDKELFQELNEQSTSDAISKKNFTEEGALAAKYYVRRWSQLKNTIEELMEPLGIVAEGGIANMSRRNVATSRIAELLGLENLVAKSRTVDILDQATGQTIRGNLMDQAKGKGYSDVSAALAANKITSGFMRDLINLQVLDMLCGQADRHAGNMMYITEKRTTENKDEEEVVTGIQGIDNDGAFGTNTDVVSWNRKNRKDLRVVDPKTLEMTIPYMDDHLATRILELDRGVVSYVLKDLLTEEEIEATCKRLDILKAGIKKTRDEHKERFLNEEKDWTLQESVKDLKADTVEGALFQSYNDYDDKFRVLNRNVSSLIKQKAREVYKHDQKTVKAIELYEDNRRQFFQEYPGKKGDKYIDARDKVYAIVDKETRLETMAKRNYFGRIMYGHAY